MIELKLFNVHKLVESKEKAEKLISLGFSIFKDEKNIMGVNVNEIVNEVKEEAINVVGEIKEATKKNIKG